MPIIGKFHSSEVSDVSKVQRIACDLPIFGRRWMDFALAQFFLWWAEKNIHEYTKYRPPKIGCAQLYRFGNAQIFHGKNM